MIADGTLEALKWFALACMTLDHVNKYLPDGAVPWMFAAGRLALPIFAIVLAYNLARRDSPPRYGRTLARLAIAAAVATPPFLALGKLPFGVLPLNILATLLVATAIMSLLDAGGILRRWLALALFVVGGALVEFWWPAVALAVSAHAYFRRPSAIAAALCLSSAALLGLVNGNHWALLGLALPVAASAVRLRMPRIRHFFYIYYPSHLVALWLATTLW